MNWHLDKNRPICPQMEEHLCAAIATGALPPGSRLPSIRDMAVEASVNPNTVQKALEGLEQKGLLYSVRGSGWYVSEETQAANRLLMDMIRAATTVYLQTMNRYGIDKESTIALIKEWQE